MLNHKWKNDKCLRCGLERKRKTVKRRMAIVNHPPYDVYKYETFWVYYHFIEGWKFDRPDCADSVKSYF